MCFFPFAIYIFRHFLCVCNGQRARTFPLRASAASAASAAAGWVDPVIYIWWPYHKLPHTFGSIDGRAYAAIQIHIFYENVYKRTSYRTRNCSNHVLFSHIKYFLSRRKFISIVRWKSSVSLLKHRTHIHLLWMLELVHFTDTYTRHTYALQSTHPNRIHAQSICSSWTSARTVQSAKNKIKIGETYETIENERKNYSLVSGCLRACECASVRDVDASCDAWILNIVVTTYEGDAD